jgi:hypothetical protein
MNAAGFTRRGAVAAVAAAFAAPAIAGPVADLQSSADATAHLAIGADPVFALIEAHRTATALHGAALKEQDRLEQLNEPGAWEVSEAPCHADVAAWRELVNTAPQTRAGLRAWAFYLEEVRSKEEWMLEEEAPAIVETLARAIVCI